MEVMKHGGVPFEHAFGEGLGEFQVLAHAVAIVVVLDVFAPVHHQGLAAGSGVLLRVVVGVDGALAAIDFEHRRNEGDDVVADLLDERGLFDDHAVGELDEHLGAAGFGRVDAAIGPVNGLGGVEEFLGLFRGDFARVAEFGEHVLIFVEIFEGGLVGDSEGDDVAAFFGLTHLPDASARGGFREGFVVALDVLGVGEFARFAGDAAEEFERRRDGGGGGHVVHQFGGDAGVLKVFADELVVLLVLRLRGERDGLDRRGFPLFCLGAGGGYGAGDQPGGEG